MTGSTPLRRANVHRLLLERGFNGGVLSHRSGVAMLLQFSGLHCWPQRAETRALCGMNCGPALSSGWCLPIPLSERCDECIQENTGSPSMASPHAVPVMESKNSVKREVALVTLIFCSSCDPVPKSDARVCRCRTEFH